MSAPSHTNGDTIAGRNRQNAQHSTGPSTPKGKAVSSMNALKHGLSLQRHAILVHESQEDYATLCREICAIFNPQSPREDFALQEIMQCRWALQRFDEAEACLLEFHFADNADPNQDVPAITYGASLAHFCLPGRGGTQHPAHVAFALHQRYRGHWDRRHQRALAEFDRAQRARRQEAREARAEQEAIRKAEREAAAERRREELHELRVAMATEKRIREQERNARSKQANQEAALKRMMDEYLQTPPPGLSEDQLADLGFVSSSSQAAHAGSEILTQSEEPKAA